MLLTIASLAAIAALLVAGMTRESNRLAQKQPERQVEEEHWDFTNLDSEAVAAAFSKASITGLSTCPDMANWDLSSVHSFDANEMFKGLEPQPPLGICLEPPLKAPESLSNATSP